MRWITAVATVQVRQGSSGADVALTSGASLPYECILEDAGAGAQQSCDPADGSGEVSFGWADNPPNPQAVGAPPLLPDDTWNTLSPIFSGVVGDLGIAIPGAGLSVQLERVMGVDSAYSLFLFATKRRFLNSVWPRV